MTESLVNSSNAEEPLVASLLLPGETSWRAESLAAKSGLWLELGRMDGDEEKKKMRVDSSELLDVVVI